MPDDATSPFPHGRSAPAAQLSPRLLDGLRGLAALAVLVTHLFSLAPPLPEGWRDALLATPLRLVLTGRAPVIFFFVLSGYVLMLALLREAAPSWPGFALRRTVRLLPPVVVSVLVSAILCLSLRDIHIGGGGEDLDRIWSGAVTGPAVLRQALLVGADGGFPLNIPLWTLVHEWRVSLVFPLLLLARGRTAWLLAGAASLCALAIAVGAAPDRLQLGPRLASTLVANAYVFPAFAVGAALALGGRCWVLTGWTARGVATAAVTVAAALPFDAASVGAAVLLIVLARTPGALAWLLARPVLRWLGAVSFSLYLIHMPVLAAMAHGLGGAIGLWPALLAGVPAALAAAALFHALVEAPARRLSRRVGAVPGWGAAGAARVF